MKEWPLSQIAFALRAEVETCYHPAEGKGTLFHVGLSHTHLSLWPQTGHLQLLTPSLTLDAYRMHPCAIEEDAAYASFTGGRKGNFRHLWIYADGTTSFIFPGSTDNRYLTPVRLTPKTNSLGG